MRIAVCDDNIFFLRQIQKELKKMDCVDVVETYSKLDIFMMNIESGRKYDVILMDIDLQTDKNGMEAAEEVYKIAPTSRIVYVTGFNDRYSQHILLHKANLLGYVTKPVDMEILGQYFEKAIDERQKATEPILVIKSYGKPISIALREIEYIESREHSVYVHTIESEFSAYEKLADLAKRLPDEFCQCHKSYIVHLSQIKQIGDKDIYLKNGGQIPVSRANMKNLRESYLRYVGTLYD